LAEPEIIELEVSPEDEFLVIACDGLWDVFENQDVVDFVRISMDTFHDPKKVGFFYFCGNKKGDNRFGGRGH
jgi:serine/threonine protein phosphatase PrpC